MTKQPSPATRQIFDEPLPNWPLLMTTSLACRYLSLDEDSFQHLANASDVRPVELGLSVIRWRRNDLDRMIAKFPMGRLVEPERPPYELAGFEAALLDKIFQAIAIRSTPTATANALAVTIKGAADLVGLSKGTIYRMVSDRQLPSYRVGSRILIKREDLVALLTSKTADDGAPRRGRPPARR